jgi:hypothetical protein
MTATLIARIVNAITMTSGWALMRKAGWKLHSTRVMPPKMRSPR